jgi:putative oxidoreductase
MNLTVTVLRLLIGSLFAGHGAQKLFGWFGGPGLKQTGDAFQAMGLKPGQPMATMAAISEFGGGLCLVTGLATPLAAAELIGVMAEAIRSVHASKGPWSTEGGWEYNAVLIAVLAAIVEHGPGPLSLDRALGFKLKGPLWALISLGAGLAGPGAAQRVLQQLMPEDANPAA